MKWVNISRMFPTKEGKYLVCCASADPEKPFITTAWFHPLKTDDDCDDPDYQMWSLILPHWANSITHWAFLVPPKDLKKDRHVMKFVTVSQLRKRGDS